ncbi:molecular chaperone DnaJ [Microbacterium sp. Root61]|uniref:DnaJ family domain-containing protein n=1 Tax=Microbacterium sp. Root61 TaxID=1736570 RepID=UPI0006FFB2AE|nr:DUF1992 domain-containing protein [Microbacterium sp. Root61]KRA25250.1 molecular chaperone DnaJ [Microbacterium sp. Root61]
MTEDPRLEAARYLVERLARENPGDEPESDAAPDAETAPEPPASAPPRHLVATDRSAYIETSIQQAIRRGEFDDLPGAGKPLPDLGDHHDPDWWIRRKIQTEQLTGLGPPALTLRVEAAELPDRLDEMSREEEVRQCIEDFNKRVIQARMQLQGGPPVVTPTRAVEAEVIAWRERRTARAAAEERDRLEAEQEHTRTRRWWRRTAP